jgi:hypothetical protein
MVLNLRRMINYLAVKDNEEGNRNEGAEENSQVGGEGDLKGEGHGGNGLIGTEVKIP